MEQTTVKPKASPKDFFLHIGAIAVLYFVVINLVQLVFQTIDFAFPPTPEAAGYIPDVSFPIAALIIGFPLYLALMWVVARGEAKDPARRELAVRRWLAYLTLFIAGAAIAVDLIYLLTAFLRGDEITTGFLLKVFVVLMIAGVIFGHYLTDIRAVGYAKKYFALGGTILAVLAITFGFSVFGTPATQRAMRFDSDRVGDLQTIQWQVVQYWQAKETVPQNLSDLNDPTRGVQVPVDPRTGEQYGYEKLSTTGFKICAIFERESIKTGFAATDYARTGVAVPEATKTAGQPFLEQDYWTHGVGTTCFTRTIDPSYYPKTTVTR